MLPAQILAGILLSIVLALPIIVRYIINFNIDAVINILLGAIFIVLLAVCLGIISGGKKLFEIIFFMLTYAVTQKIPAIDYLGATPHQDSANHMVIIAILILSLGTLSFFVRNYQARHL